MVTPMSDSAERVPSPEDTFPGEPMDREQLAEFFAARYGSSAPPECGQTITYILAGSEPEHRTTYRCGKPTGHKDHHHYDGEAHVSWTTP